MSNFAQFVGLLPTNGEAFSLKLSKGWDDLPAGHVALNQTEVRRALGIPHTPKSVKVEADNPAYAGLVSLGRTSQAQVEKFEAMALRAKDNKSNAKLMASLRELLGS